jgi:hypothetical protein
VGAGESLCGFRFKTRDLVSKGPPGFKAGRLATFLGSHPSAGTVGTTDSIRYVPKGPEPPEPKPADRIGTFEVVFRGLPVVHYQSGVAALPHPGGHEVGCAECENEPRVVEWNGEWVDLPPFKDTQDPEGMAVHLRKRGKPLLTAALLLNAKGPVLMVPSRHVTHLNEALANGRIEDIGVFDDPNDPEDDTRIDLGSNRWGLDFIEADLRFEVLNARAVRGAEPDFDVLTDGLWEVPAMDRPSRLGDRPLGPWTHQAHAPLMLGEVGTLDRVWTDLTNLSSPELRFNARVPRAFGIWVPATPPS